ncbi:MAG TPA: hypothetical protein VEH84_15195 [Alphaproteobacteria bacterium]|nr:hypothetical protein [Alphaproteobacteria bacterium]
MPIRPEYRWFYPIDWPLISRAVRFDRARGRCEVCGKPHRAVVTQLRDGRWADPAEGVWRDAKGRPCAVPDLVEYAGSRQSKVILTTMHLDGRPWNNDPANLMAACLGCHSHADRPLHIERRRLTFLRRRALGDLFDGRYPTVLEVLDRAPQGPERRPARRPPRVG